MNFIKWRGWKNYLRTKDGEEIDFALTYQDSLVQMIEVKASDSTLSPSLLKFHKKYGVPALQLVKSLRNEHSQHNIPLLKGENFLSQLFL